MSGFTFAVVDDYYNERVDLITRVVIDQFINTLSAPDKKLVESIGDCIYIDFTQEDVVRLRALMYMLEKELGTSAQQLLRTSLQKSVKYGNIQLELEQALDNWGQARCIGETTSE